MKTLRFLFLPVLLLHVATASLSAQNGEPSELMSFRLEFQAKLAELHKPLNELTEKYRGYLEKQKAAYQQQGMLKPMLAVDEELKTFENPSPDGAEPTLSAFPKLKRLQQIYREQRAAKETALAAPRLALIGASRKQAGELAAEWTKAGKIEEAKLALAEAERLGGLEKDAELATQAGQTLSSGPAKRTGNNFEGRTAGEEMRNGKGIKLCWITAGNFTMGSPEEEPERETNKEAQVEVELTSGFWLGKFEVTQDEYEAIAGINPSKLKSAGEDAPVEQVTWDEALAFCEKLTELEHKSGKLPEEWAYTLPTEAQWEYACRAGEEGPYSGGDLDELGWFADNSDGKTHEVGRKNANAWGLHDMHGNVREWCLDWAADELMGGQNPPGPDSGSSRINRGGRYYNELNYCRAAHRASISPATRHHGIGFRLCLSFSE